MSSRGFVLLPIGVGICMLAASLFLWVRPYFEGSSVPSVHVSSKQRDVFPRIPEPIIPPVVTSTIPVASKESSVLFVGDVMLDRKVSLLSKKAKDLGYPFRQLPEGWFNQADFTVANLEGVLTSKRLPPEKSIDFQFDPAALPFLQETGIDAFSQANNHTLDQGRVGADDARARLRAGGFLVFGDQVHDDDVALATTTIRGETFAFLGFNTTDNPLDKIAAAAVLEKAHQEAQHVLVFMHWGTEYVDHAPTAVVDESHWLIDHGADVVIGGHPHWVQGIYTYKGKPIVYSLGNFVFDQDFSQKTQEGLAIKLLFEKNGVNIQPIPIKIVKSQPSVVEGEEKTKRLLELSEISQTDLREQIKKGDVTISP